MSPYDIAPSANPRIPVELKFFLTDDYHKEVVKKKMVQTQTDELKGDGKVSVVARKTRDKFGREILEYKPEVLYIPKKTGIDAFTQVENDELFNFDREVEPIVKVLVTKTLEQAMLELEEDVELENMKKFKQDVVQRYVSKNDSDWNNIVDVESEKVLKLNSEIEALTSTQVRQELLSLKVAAHHAAHNYLRDLELATLDSLESRGRYRPSLEDRFNTSFMEYITGEMLDFLREDFQIEAGARQLFPEVEPKLQQQRDQQDQAETRRRSELARVEQYRQSSQRHYYVYYENEAANKPLVFSCFNSLVLDGSFDSYVQSMLPKFEDMLVRFEKGLMGEEEFSQIFAADMPDPAKTLEFFRLDRTRKLAFGFANNPCLRLLRTDRVFTLKAVHIGPDFSIKETASHETRKQQHQSVSWEYATPVPAADKNDEEVVRFLQDAPQPGSFTFLYLFCEDFEPHLHKLEAIKASEYRLFESDTNTNYLHSQLGKYHDQLFAVNPDDLRAKPAEPVDGEVAEPVEQLRCLVGCALVYQNKQGYYLDHLNSHVYDRVDEKTLLDRALQSLRLASMAGDTKGMMGFWSARLDARRAEDELKGAKKPSKQDDDDDDLKLAAAFDDKKQPKEDQPEPKLAPGQLHCSQFIGPVDFDALLEDYDALHAKVDAALQKQNPQLREEFPDGFEILYKSSSLHSTRKLQKVSDYRVLTFHPLQKEADGLADGDPQDDVRLAAASDQG